MFDHIEIHEDDREEVKILKQILHALRRIEDRLKPRFDLHIQQVAESTLKNQTTFWRKDMAAITAGQSASFFLSATASDNSTPVLSAQTLTADDTNVQIAQDGSDASGNTFTVTVPASDTQTSFNLSATAQVTSNTSTTAQDVSASLSVTISPASQSVTFQLVINEK